MTAEDTRTVATGPEQARPAITNPPHAYADAAARKEIQAAMGSLNTAHGAFPRRRAARPLRRSGLNREQVTHP